MNNGSGSGTGSALVFLDSARQLAMRLRHDVSPIAKEMVREAELLADTFGHWHLHRPDDEVRLNTIKRLVDLNRRAMDFLTQGVEGRR